MEGVDRINYYNEIKSKLVDTEVYGKIKDYSKERHRVITYYEIGKLLVDAGSRYGEDIIGKYAEKLIVDVGRKYNKKSLFKMRQLFLLFENEKVAPMVRQLSWSQCLLLIPIKDINKVNYYINQVIIRKLSKRDLQKIINSNEYERLPNDTKNKLIKQEETSLEDFVKNPIVLKNKNNFEFITEKNLQNIIMEDIPSFLKELGEGYSFISNEYKIKIGDTYNYIDILLYNIKYKCYVVIELKVTELKKEYIGQIEVYMNYIDKYIKGIDDNESVGIIICRRDNKFIIEFCSNSKILSREYILM